MDDAQKVPPQDPMGDVEEEKSSVVKIVGILVVVAMLGILGYYFLSGPGASIAPDDEAPSQEEIPADIGLDLPPPPAPPAAPAAPEV